MKAHGKGMDISIQRGNSTSNVLHYKQAFAATPPAPVLVFKPLVVKQHPRSADMAAYKALPSKYS